MVSAFKELNKINFEVIFTTAHSEFAIDAIKCSALDYLLKPINYIDLLKTVKKYESKLHKASQQEKLMLLIENLDTGNSAFNKTLPTETGFELVKRMPYCIVKPIVLL
jgi:two-component system LytT family response regulator